MRLKDNVAGRKRDLQRSMSFIDVCSACSRTVQQWQHVVEAIIRTVASSPAVSETKIQNAMSLYILEICF